MSLTPLSAVRAARAHLPPARFGPRLREVCPRLSAGLFLLVLAGVLYPFLFGPFPSAGARESETESARSTPATSLVAKRQLYIRTARCIRVIDGDSIVISFRGREEEVRYIGVDAPEYRDRYDRVNPYGVAATIFNRHLVEGKEVTLDYDVQLRDHYGRLLAYVYVDGLFVNGELIRQGYASVFPQNRNVKHQALLKQLENEAKTQRRGIWKSWKIR